MTPNKLSQPCHLLLSYPNESPNGPPLGLQQGDLLIAVNGAPFVDGEDALRMMFHNARGKGLLLTFQRGEHRFSLFAYSSRLGEWQRLPLDEPLPESAVGLSGAKVDPATLVNWMFLMRRNGDYDVVSEETSLMALVFPPFWLLQMHLWQEFAAFFVAMMVCIAVSPWIGVMVYIGTGIALLQQGGQLFKNERAARGFPLAAVIAAPTEAEAHRVFQALHPRARFVYAAAPAAPKTA